MAPEVLFEPRDPPRPVSRMRSSIILASRASLLGAGHGPAYDAALDPDARRAIDETVGGQWLPLDVAAAHYRACDAIGLSDATVAALGYATNDRVKGTLYGTFIRIFNEAGGTPWQVLPHWQRFWDRAYDGGGLRVTKLGPKDARVDVAECSLLESRYYRNALRGLSHGFLEVFCKKAYVSEVSTRRPRDGVSFRYQWV